MPELETVAPSDDIRSALAAAITEHETPEPAPKLEAKEAPELPLETETEPKGEARERGEDGKFVKKEAKTETEPEAKETKAETAEEGKEKPEGDDKNSLSPDFQKTLAAWKPADQAMFKTLAPDAQQFVMRRYKEMNADYTKKLQDISRIKTEYDPIDKMFEPHREVMKQKGFTPASLVESWANVEKKLASGEQGALEVIGGLINGYKVSRDKVAQLIGVRQSAPAQQQTEQPQPQAQIQLPPELVNELTTLRQQVNGLSQQENARVEAARSAAGEKAMQEIEQFKSAVDDKGNLLHPYFEEVEQKMVILANSYVREKQPVPDITALYEEAVFAVPSTREKMLTVREQAEQKKRVDQEKAKAAAARKAAVSVTGAPGNSQASQVRNAPDRSLREELEANAAEALSAA